MSIFRYALDMYAFGNGWGYFNSKPFTKITPSAV